ncbi:MAG: bifunctional UDP-N-acetylglucosamine diphosphorylase/glucosamine-1-phosphate N-acetyltransferase GlmU, partial [Pseudomonadota bacterium]
MATQLVLLAAGQGKRMKSDMPKVLHPVAGLPLFAHAMASAAALDLDRKVVVVGNGADAVKDAVSKFDPAAVTVHQAERLGTGHAVNQARDAVADAGGRTLVLYGDTPFVQGETFQAMSARLDAGADIVVLGFEPEDTARYGRLVVNGDTLLKIVEHKDATKAERAIGLCNSGVIMADTEALFELVSELKNENAAGEYYLTDAVALGHAKGLVAAVVVCDEQETLGVDSRADLARANAIFQDRARATALENGVTLEAPETVYFSHDTQIEPDVTIEPNVVFGTGVTVKAGAHVRAFSHLEGASIGANAVVGPYARLRPGAEIGENAKVGNFVEIKNTDVGDGAKVNHLSYIGDAAVGAKANIGAGTVTCNYDGVSKHHTDIGEAAFIGSNSILVAPVKIGAEAYTGSGSVITEDVPDEAMAIGRARQTNNPAHIIASLIVFCQSERGHEPSPISRLVGLPRPPYGHGLIGYIF